jgi:hypothetical protein
MLSGGLCATTRDWQQAGAEAANPPLGPELCPMNAKPPSGHSRMPTPAMKRMCQVQSVAGCHLPCFRRRRASGRTVGVAAHRAGSPAVPQLVDRDREEQDRPKQHKPQQHRLRAVVDAAGESKMPHIG